LDYLMLQMKTPHSIETNDNYLPDDTE